MTDVTITLDGVNSEVREKAIGRMLEVLRESIAKLPEGSVEGRNAALLMDIMPGFFRSLDRERIRLAAGVTAEKALGVMPRDSEALEQFLMVMTLPLVNMAVCIVSTAVPCDHTGPCKCTDVRRLLFRGVAENFSLNVNERLRQARGVNANGKAH